MDMCVSVSVFDMARVVNAGYEGLVCVHVNVYRVLLKDTEIL